MLARTCPLLWGSESGDLNPDAGNTETVAGYITGKTGIDAVDIGDLSGEDVAGYDGLIVGAPTWHTGADTERSGTAWDDFIYGDLTGLDLAGKKVGCPSGRFFSDWPTRLA